jgi:hypothetical protein
MEVDARADWVRDGATARTLLFHDGFVVQEA